MADDQSTKEHSQTEENEVEEVVNAETSGEEKDPRDAITEDHPRFKEVYDNYKNEKEARENLERELNELKTIVSSQNKSSDEDVYTEEEEQALDRILKGLKKKGGVVTKEDLESAQRTEKRANAIRDLEKEYSGENGLPKFDTNDVMEHAQRSGFGDNYRAAYRDLHFNAIVRHEAKRAKVESVDSEQPSGSKDREFLSDIEKLQEGGRGVWNKKGDKIMSDFKKSIFGR